MRWVVWQSVVSIVLSLWLLGHSSWAFSATRDLIIARGDGDYPPYEMVDQGQLSGIHIDVINAVATSLGVTVQYEIVPWKRAVVMLQSGAVDAVTYMARTPERERFGIFLEGNRLASTQNAFFRTTAKPFELEYDGDLQQLKSFSIGVLQGYHYSRAFSDADFLQVDTGAKHEVQLLKKLLGQRFDLALGNVGRIKYFTRALGVDQQIEFLKPYFPSRPNYLVFSRQRLSVQGRHDLALEFSQAMQRFRETPAFEAILQRYQVTPEDY